MPLNRIWYPSPNYSASRARNQLVVVHTSEGSTDQLGLATFLANPSSQVSYHVCYDNKGDSNTIVECVRRQNKSWSALNANDWGVHGCCCTPNGASANWSRETWLNQSIMLQKCAAWISEECAFYGIPLIKVNASDIQAGKMGVCGHKDCTEAGAGGGHFDPGNNFPWDIVLSGSSPPPVPSGPFPTYPRRFPLPLKIGD
jgi:hypothetical protein